MNAATKRDFGIAIIAIALSGLAATANADSWQQHHPRRTEVNGRLANQDRRIHQDVNNGTLTHSQARALHKDDHQFRQEERDMAHQDGGHISKPEQRMLNQQENGVSNQIPPK